MIGARARVAANPRMIRRRAKTGSIASLRHAGGAIRLTARRSIRRSPRPAAPGRAPHTRKGKLKHALAYAVRKQDQKVIIGPRHSSIGRSAAAHEHGGRVRGQHFPKRPFMGPALLKLAPKLPRHWANSIQGG